MAHIMAHNFWENERGVFSSKRMNYRNNSKIAEIIAEINNVRKKMGSRRILRQYGYPPDKTKIATELVLDQANMICRDWAEIN